MYGTGLDCSHYFFFHLCFVISIKIVPYVCSSAGTYVKMVLIKMQLQK